LRDVHEDENILLWAFNEQKKSSTLVSRSLIGHWLRSPLKRKCQNVVFDPRPPPFQSSGERNFNLWRGFDVPNEAVDKIQISNTATTSETVRALGTQQIGSFQAETGSQTHSSTVGVAKGSDEKVAASVSPASAVVHDSARKTIANNELMWHSSNDSRWGSASTSAQVSTDGAAMGLPIALPSGQTHAQTIDNGQLPARTFRPALPSASPSEQTHGQGISKAQLETAIQPFLDHILWIWCQRNDKHYRYCIRWMASLLQRPWYKMGVALVLRGDPGSGKGGIVTEILGKIIDECHFSHVRNLEHICGQFNGPALATASLVYVDDTNCAGTNRWLSTCRVPGSVPAKGMSASESVEVL
jgi:hypothetical protein